MTTPSLPCPRCGTPLSPDGLCPRCAGPAPLAVVPAYVDRRKSRVVALLLELLPALFGFLGFGWLYAGRVEVGLAVLFGYWAWSLLALLLDLFTGFFVCLHLPGSLAFIGASVYFLVRYTDRHPDRFE